MDEDEKLKYKILLTMHHYDPYQQVALILMNCAQTEIGRNFVLKIRKKDQDDIGILYLQLLLIDGEINNNIHANLKLINPKRRRGVAGTIKNCVCTTNIKNNAWWLMNVVKIMDLYILYPLAGNKELNIDKKIGMHPNLWILK